MNDEFIEDISDTSQEEDNTATVSDNEVYEVSSIDSDIGDSNNDNSIFEDVQSVVVDDVCIEDNNCNIDDSIIMEEVQEYEMIDYSVSLDNISSKLDNIVTSISDNKLDYVYDYNYNVVSILLLSAVVGVLLFSLFTRRF